MVLFLLKDCMKLEKIGFRRCFLMIAGAIVLGLWMIPEFVFKELYAEMMIDCPDTKH